MTLVFYLLLNLLHFLNNVYCFIKQLCVKIFLFMKNHVYSYKSFQNYLSLENSGDNLASKLPKHIAILIGLEEISIVDIIKLIDWCITAQIPYISFYDHKGVLQKSYPCIEKKLKQQASILHDAEWVDQCNKKDNSTKIIKVNGNEYNYNVHSNSANKFDKQSIKIQFLSYLDGKNKIVSLTKQLSTFLECNDNHEKDITSQFISENLNWNVKIPEPDLAIVFGKTMCSYGFLPWHTRITEFFVVPTHCGILYDDFIRILIKYSKCQQHYGK